MEYTEIDIEVVDITAKADGQCTASEKQSFSDLADLDAEETVSPPDVATLEKDFWTLDGTKDCFPDNPSDYSWGWWTLNQSGSDGAFSAATTLPREFAANHTSLGLTLIFGGDCWASGVNVKWYDSSGTLLANKDFIPTGMVFYCKQTVENYRKVVLNFSGTSKPYRYLKLLDLIWGERKVFAAGDITHAVLLEEYDPISAEVKINTLDFSIYSLDDDFSVMNPAGAYMALQRRQPIKPYIINGTTRTKLGVFYLDTWGNSAENVSDMTSVNPLGVLDSIPFPETFYSSTSIATALTSIINVSGVNINLDSSFSAEVLTGKIEAGTCREAVQQIAFAIGAAVNCRRSAEVYLETPETVSVGTIPKTRQVNDQAVEMKTLVTGVEVTAHSYSGTTDTTTIVGVYMQNLPANAAKNVLQITDATLVTTANAQACAQRVFDYYQKRYVQTGEYIWSGEQAGDVFTVPSLAGGTIEGRLESMETDLVNGLTGAGRLVGSVV